MHLCVMHVCETYAVKAVRLGSRVHYGLVSRDSMVFHQLSMLRMYVLQGLWMRMMHSSMVVFVHL